MARRPLLDAETLHVSGLKLSVGRALCLRCRCSTLSCPGCAGLVQGSRGAAKPGDGGGALSLLVGFCGTSGSCCSPLTISVPVLFLFTCQALGSHRRPRVQGRVASIGPPWGSCAWSCGIERSGLWGSESCPRFCASSGFFFLVDPRLFASHRRKEDVGTVRDCVCVFLCYYVSCGTGVALLASWI